MPATEIIDMMKVLRIERAHTKKELKNLDRVISALRELSTKATLARRGKKRMSTAARRKIGAAQRKRWAKFHKQRAGKG